MYSQVMCMTLFYIFFHFYVLFAISTSEIDDLSIPPELQTPIQPDSNLYAFGDSNFETGDIGRKSRDHDSWMKTGYYPYGTSCEYISDDRFSDGKTVPEFIASSLPFAGIDAVDQPWPTTLRGVNYASASAGILPETGSAFHAGDCIAILTNGINMMKWSTLQGNNLCLKEQIGVFKEYMQTELKNKLGEKLSNYLSTSIYLINVGESDYIFNYLQPKYYNTSNRYNEEEFAELLSKAYSNYIKDLYKLGARRMVIFEIRPLGCLPYMIEKLKPRTKCADHVNEMVSKFNKKLDIMIKELRNELKDLHLVTARMFSLIKNMVEAPADYGFEETRWPCCPIAKNGTGLCEKTVFRDIPPSEQRIPFVNPDVEHWTDRNRYMCEDPTMPEEWKKTQKWTGQNKEYVCLYKRVYLFFDELHFTQAANRVIVERLVAGTGGSCSPFGLDQLYLLA